MYEEAGAGEPGTASCEYDLEEGFGVLCANVSSVRDIHDHTAFEPPTPGLDASASKGMLTPLREYEVANHGSSRGAGLGLTHVAGVVPTV